MKTEKRILLYLLGLLVLAIGINVSKSAGLGISPVSSIPYALELIWGIGLGKATYIVYLALIGLQIILLRKNYKVKNLLQIVPTFILGTLITYTGTDYLLFWLPAPNNYFFQFIYLCASILIIGLGVSLVLMPDIMPFPAEGLSNAIVLVSRGKIKFGNAKVMVDSGMVLISAILSLIFLGGLKTVREGTILAALFVGKVVDIILKKSHIF